MNQQNLCTNEWIIEMMDVRMNKLMNLCQNSIWDWTKAKITKHLLNKNKFEKRNSNRTKQESL